MSNDIQQLVASLASLVTALGTTSGQAAPSSTSSFTKPEAFKGSSTTEARNFLAGFESWASERTDLRGDVQKKIKAALQLCSSIGATWAASYLAKINSGETPFLTWADFVKAFKGRWIIVDEVADATAKLKVLRQRSNQPMAEFAAQFQDIGARTALEDTGKLVLFLENISPAAKNLYALANAVASDDRKADTFEKAIGLCLRLDQSMNDPSLGVGRGSSTRFAAHSSAVDPYAMQVDATSTSRTKDDFRRQMGGRCFGCGLAGHRFKSDTCRAKGARCNYCRRENHFENVCEDKFCGRERGRGQSSRPGQRQRVAATSSAPFSLFPEESGLQGTEPNSPTVNYQSVNANTPSVPASPAPLGPEAVAKANELLQLFAAAGFA